MNGLRLSDKMQQDKQKQEREQEMDYKIIVLDLDGTLTNRDKIITPRTKKALMEAQEAGSIVVLASGRPTAGVEPLARELELHRFGSYILSYNGGMITHCRTGETVFASLLPRESNEKIIGLSEKYRVDLLTYYKGEIITNNRECPYAVIESRLNHLPLRQVEDMRSFVNFQVPKFLFLEDGDYLVTVEPLVKAAMGRDFSIYRSEEYFLEIMPKGIDKARSLERLLKLLGLGREQMIACGDGHNDLTMIQYAGLGVAMENAVLSVRTAADHITASNNHDGVGMVVERFMLGRV